MQTIVLLHNCKKDTWKHIFIMTVNNTIKLHKLINYNKSQMKIIVKDCVTVADKSCEAIKCLYNDNCTSININLITELNTNKYKLSTFCCAIVIYLCHQNVYLIDCIIIIIIIMKSTFYCSIVRTLTCLFFFLFRNNPHETHQHVYKVASQDLFLSIISRWEIRWQMIDRRGILEDREYQSFGLPSG